MRLELCECCNELAKYRYSLDAGPHYRPIPLCEEHAEPFHEFCGKLEPIERSALKARTGEE